MPSPSSPEDRWLDRIIDNRYRVTERIGRGGMGTVYKVVHTAIGKVAAIKLLHGNLADDAELARRFHREAEAISRLNHPNIVQVFDFGRVDNTLFLVMEYLQGEDLATILRRDGPMDLERCGPLLLQICDALTEAHESGIVHRDLKPENVRVSRTRDGQDFAKVLDFGLAKMLMDDEPDAAITAQGNLVGTPYYMAPEMIRAQPLDGRADLYSLGAMAYRMLTGENPFIANTPVGVLTKHITDELEPPSRRAPERTISDELDHLVLRAMAKDPAQRYQSAVEIKRDLFDLLGQTTPGGHSLPLHPGRSQVIVPRRRDSDSLSQSERELLARSPTGRLEQEEVESRLDQVLSKEDLAFERRLRRGRLLKPLLLLALLGSVGFAVYWYGYRDAPLYAPPREVEPNNNPAEATPLLSGKPVRGQLGKRVSDTESDRDWYAINVRGSGPQRLHVTVGRIPNMDLTLELYDGSTKPGKIVGADSAGTGASETISNWTLDPGRYFILVREVWEVGVPPTENVTDSYTLIARWGPQPPGWEMEPNDRSGQENELHPGESVRGILGAVDDVDRFRVRTDRAVTIDCSVSAVTGVDLVLEAVLGPGKPLRADAGRAAAGEQLRNLRLKANQSLVLQVRRRQQKKLMLMQDTPGIDSPYTLTVTVR